MKTSKQGMRAEDIREGFGVQAKEMPRILKEGLATKKLKSKGQEGNDVLRRLTGLGVASRSRSM